MSYSSKLQNRELLKMKKIALPLLISVLLGCAAPAQKPLSINESTDKFTGISEVSTDLIKLNPARSINFIKIEDKKTKGLSAVIFKYYRDSANDNDVYLSRQWLFINNNRGHLMIDGKPYSLGNGTHTAKTAIKGGLHLIEIVAYTLNPEVVNKLAEAKAIEGKVGDSEFTLTPTQIEFINQFAQKSL